MIKAKHGGQYKQVGFIKVRQPDGTYKDVEKKYGKINGGEYGLVFEKGFTREVEGELPLTLNGIGKPLKDYDIEGNTYQSDKVSPDTPQEVKAVGDKTANLINTNTIVKGRLDNGVLGYEEETTELIVSGNVIKCTTAKAWRGFVTDFIPVEQGGYFLYHIATPNDITYTYRMSVYDSQKNFVRVTAQSERTITINEGEAFIRVSYQLGVAGTFEISNIMLSKGKTALPYEPYGYKVDVVSKGKNLYSWDGNLLGSSSLIVSSNKDVISSVVDVREINTIYFTGDNTLLNSGAYRISKSDTPIEVGSTIKTYDASFSGGIYDVSDCNYLLITASIYAMPQENREIIKSTFMLNTGTTPEPYEPYTPPITTPIYLDSPLYKIGDYSDSIGSKEEVRVIKELVLTGEEDWAYITGGKHWTPVTTYQKSGLMCTCSHYEAVKNGGGSSFIVNGQVGFYSTAADRLIFCNTNYTTTEDWKSYLAAQYSAGTPVTVYYILAEPETKAVDAVEIPTLNGTTVIDVDAEVKPSNVYIKYKSKT